MELILNSINHEYSGDRRKVEALRDVTLRVPSGERVAIVGPSGAGKSTLLRVASGIVRPTRGAVLLNGKSPNKAWRDGKIGFVFQDPNLLSWRNVVENVRLPFEVLRSHIDADDRIRRWLAALNLADFETSYPDELSGGMRSRVAIARCVATEPRLVLMDEPFNGLDEVFSQVVMEEVLAIVDKLRSTLLFVSHNVEQAVFMADRVVVLSKRPATIAGEIEVPLPTPRTVRTLSLPSFLDAVQKVRDALYSASEVHGLAAPPP